MYGVQTKSLIIEQKSKVPITLDQESLGSTPDGAAKMMVNGRWEMEERKNFNLTK